MAMPKSTPKTTARQVNLQDIVNDELLDERDVGFDVVMDVDLQLASGIYLRVKVIDGWAGRAVNVENRAYSLSDEVKQYLQTKYLEPIVVNIPAKS